MWFLCSRRGLFGLVSLMKGGCGQCGGFIISWCCRPTFSCWYILPFHSGDKRQVSSSKAHLIKGLVNKVRYVKNFRNPDWLLLTRRQCCRGSELTINTFLQDRAENTADIYVGNRSLIFSVFASLILCKEIQWKLITVSAFSVLGTIQERNLSVPITLVRVALTVLLVNA